jgi:hypothetical protein
MGRHARERALEPQEPKGSHPPPRQPSYSADATKWRYKGRIAWRAPVRSVDRGQQSLERRPIERWLDPVQKSAALPAPAHHRIHERTLRQVTGGTSENHPL